MDDAVGHSIQRYFDALYVSADLHRRLSDESGCLSKLKSAIQTLQRRNMTQIDVRLVLGDALHTYAVALREFKHLEEAAVSVREALRLFPPAIPKSEHPYQTARYLQTLGTILTDQGDHSRALPVFQEAVELLDQRNEPDAPHMLSLALNNTGLCARKCGLNDLAISAYQGCIHIRESIMRSQPEDWSIQDQTAGTLSNLSSVLCDLGRREEALEAIDKALAYRWMLIRKTPEPELRVSLAKARHNRAAVLYQMERWVEAVKEYADTIETLMPLLEMEGRSDLRSLVKSATSSQDSAIQRIEEWDVKKADQMYAELIPGERRAMKELTSQWRSAVLSRMLSNWAGLKRTLNQPGAAWLLLEEAIRCIDNIEPNLPLPETNESLIICHRNLGVLLAGMHAFNKAENICAKGREYCLEFGRVGKDPVFTDNYCDLSLCLARSIAAQGKTDQAAAILGELSSLSFEINGLKMTRASMQKAINEIQRHFNSCVDERNDPQLGYYCKCIAFEAQSQRQEEDLVGAARLYEKALDLNHYDETLWINLSVIYAKLKDYHRAMRGCDRALALNSRNGATWLNRGLFCFELQRFADAAASFDKAYELGIIDAGAKAEYCHDIVAGRI
jgi:tetratricopeptide (TPR) repeat protein